MKKILACTSFLTITGATLLNTLPNLNQTEININKTISNNDKELNNKDLIINENQIIEKFKSNNDDGKNDYEYRFLIHYLYLNSDITNQLQTAVLEGLPGVIAILQALPTPVAACAALWAGVLIAQWYAWNVISYDNGRGVGISIFGIVPSWFTKVWSQ